QYSVGRDVGDGWNTQTAANYRRDLGCGCRSQQKRPLLALEESGACYLPRIIDCVRIRELPSRSVDRQFAQIVQRAACVQESVVVGRSGVEQGDELQAQLRYQSTAKAGNGTRSVDRQRHAALTSGKNTKVGYGARPKKHSVRA